MITHAEYELKKQKAVEAMVTFLDLISQFRVQGALEIATVTYGEWLTRRMRIAEGSRWNNEHLECHANVSEGAVKVACYFQGFATMELLLRLACTIQKYCPGEDFDDADEPVD